MRGLARIEGELIDGDPEELTRSVCSSYELTGIVVHSGQASGGHYYSYILHRCVIFTAIYCLRINSLGGIAMTWIPRLKSSSVQFLSPKKYV